MTTSREDVRNKEQARLKDFFRREDLDVLVLPEWVTDGLIEYWHENFFYVHYVPKLSLDENFNLPLWRERPSQIFYKKIRGGDLEKEAGCLSGKWLLIDGRDKPAKKVPWIRSTDVSFLQKMGLKPREYVKRWGKQQYQREYLEDKLLEKGFGSRFCLSVHDIDYLKPFVLKFLKVDSKKTIRLPYFAEYNYLGNALYKQWGRTETWEWLEDTFPDGQHLAGGSGNVGRIGWDPPEFWSTILTFRPVIEL